MKKPLFFVWGMLMAFMPVALQAQTMQVGVTASTLDRAALASVRIYTVDLNQTYFIDSSEIHPLCLPNAVDIRTRPSAAVAVLPDGFHASVDIDSGYFAHSVIVLTDTNNRHYFLGNSALSHPDSGYFYGAALFASTHNRSFAGIVLAPTNIIGDANIAVMDNMSSYFSSLYTATEFATGNSLFLLKDAALVRPLHITRDVTIQSAPNHRFSVSGTDTVFIVLGNATMTLTGCDVNSTGGAPAISLFDAANAMVHDVSVASGIFAQWDAAATGTLTIRDSVAAATTAAIQADAYFRNGAYRKYRRSLSLAAAAATDTVFLARNTASTAIDSITSAVVVALAGDSIRGILSVDNEDGIVRLQGGYVNTLTGTGIVDLFGVDAMDSLHAADLTVVIDSSRVHRIAPATGARVLIKSGKYGGDYSNYLAPRHVMWPNADADAAEFPYVVLPGYRVVYHNWNNRGDNDTVVVCTDDNRIVPVPNPPVFPDTIFCAYWIDSLHSAPWNFQSDVLEGNTELYAQWAPYNSAVDALYTVLHYRQALNGTYPLSLCDTVHGVSTRSDSLIVNANHYAGFSADREADTTATLTDGAVITFHYVRDSFDVTYDLAGGFISTAFNNIQRYAFGSAIVYPDINTVFREGYKCIGWSPALTKVPAHDTTVHAIYAHKDYALTWTGFDTTVDYNGTNRGIMVTAVYTDDHNTVVNARLTFTDEQDNESGEAVNAGIYVVTATPLDTNYRLSGTLQTTMTIRPALVSVTGIEVDKVKEYDGNASVHVTNFGGVSVNYDSVNLYPIVTAKYFTSNGDTSYFTGKNKIIKARITLGGSAAPNYRVSPSEVVLATDGQIIDPMLFDDRGGNMGVDSVADDRGLEPQISGYCNGETSTIMFYLISGSADEYKLEFSAAAHAQGFRDTGWTALTPGANTVDVEVPATAASGDYRVWITLRRNVGTQSFESSRLGVTIHVNLPKAYVKPIFNDVITIIDTCHCIDQSTVQWYHNDVYVGSGPYYQEVGGLTGTYYATFVINGTPNRTCTQTDVTTLVADETAPVSVSVYPNPTVDAVTVQVENAKENTHSLRVMNVLGMTLLDTAFEGEKIGIDFSRYVGGSYTVIVDGIVVRVIKK